MNKYHTLAEGIRTTNSAEILVHNDGIERRYFSKMPRRVGRSRRQFRKQRTALRLYIASAGE